VFELRKIYECSLTATSCGVTDLNSADFAKAFGIVFVIVGVIVLAWSFISQYGFYFSVLGIVMIVIGAVFIVVLSTLKEAKAKSPFTRKFH
jgi:uncharacterized membrane protein HdeD (DUF308 family)